jgi:ParB family chromosome partitioning protein
MSGKVVLGRGLEALIPTQDESATGGSYRNIPVNMIVPNPAQPRRNFDDASLQELADSFKTQGVLQPIIVKKKDNGYVLIAGERRYRASRLAGMEKIPALLMDERNEVDMLQMALVENIQREDLNPLEEAEAFRRLLDESHLTQQELAARVGKSRTAVANIVRLLNLPEKVKEYIRAGKLTEGHARAILALEDDLSRVMLAERIVADNLTVRMTEESIKVLRKRRLMPKKKLPAIMELENHLKQILGTAVKITPGLKRGKIEIEFYGEEDLERLLELFKKMN